MAKERENRLIIVTGKKRIGKSNETLRNIFFELIPAGRRALFLDINDEYGEYVIHLEGGKTHIARIKRIFHKDVANFSRQTKIEAARVIPLHDDGRSMSDEEIDEAWVNAMRNFRGGVLVVEDLNRVFGDALPTRVSGALTNNTHRDCDIYLHMQSVGRILPKMRQNAEIIRVHVQFDGMEASAGKLKTEFEIFKIAQNIINKQYYAGMALLKKDSKSKEGNRLIRVYVFVNREEFRIIGNFTRKMMWEAIVEYLGQNKQAFKNLLDQSDLNGRRVYTYGQAIQIKAKQLFDMYWGND